MPLASALSDMPTLPRASAADEERQTRAAAALREAKEAAAQEAKELEERRLQALRRARADMESMVQSSGAGKEGDSKEEGVTGSGQDTTDESGGSGSAEGKQSSSEAPAGESKGAVVDAAGDAAGAGKSAGGPSEAKEADEAAGGSGATDGTDTAPVSPSQAPAGDTSSVGDSNASDGSVAVIDSARVQPTTSPNSAASADAGTTAMPQPLAMDRVAMAAVAGVLPPERAVLEAVPQLSRIVATAIPHGPVPVASGPPRRGSSGNGRRGAQRAVGPVATARLVSSAPQGSPGRRRTIGTTESALVRTLWAKHQDAVSYPLCDDAMMRSMKLTLDAIADPRRPRRPGCGPGRCACAGWDGWRGRLLG